MGAERHRLFVKIFRNTLSDCSRCRQVRGEFAMDRHARRQTAIGDAQPNRSRSAVAVHRNCKWTAAEPQSGCTEIAVSRAPAAADVGLSGRRWLPKAHTSAATVLGGKLYACLLKRCDDGSQITRVRNANAALKIDNGRTRHLRRCRKLSLTPTEHPSRSTALGGRNFRHVQGTVKV